jgi:PAS domain S-box-containing protein
MAKAADREHLISELEALRKQVAELKKKEASCQQVEMELRSSEERFRLIADNASDVIMRIVFHPEHRIDYISPSCLNILGHTQEEFYKDPELGFKRVHPEDRPIFRSLQEIDPSHPRKHAVIRWTHKDGRVIWIEEENVTIFNETGQVAAVHVVCRDITERHLAHEKIRESEDRYRTTFESANDILTFIDLSGKILDVNEKAKEIAGYEPEELIGKNIRSLAKIMSKKSKAIVVKSFLKRLVGINVEPYEVEMFKKDGTPVTFEINAVAIKKNGEVVGDLAILRDVTERRKAAQALADEAKQRRILTEQSRDGIAVLDQNGKVYESNKKFADMLGYSQDEILKLHVWDWEVNFSRKKLLDMLGSVDETGDHFETQHRRKDGSIYDVEISTNGAIFAGQKLIFCVCRDVTERNKEQEELKMFSQATAGAIDAIGLTDLEGKILYVNSAMEETYGYKKGELLGKPVTGLNSDAELADEIMSAMIKTGSWRGEIKAIKGNGETFTALLALSTVRDEKGTPIAMMGASRDITKRKKAEEALRASEEKLNSMLQSLTEQIAMMDKDLNVIWSNENAKRTFGEDIIGKRCYRAFHGRERPCRNCPILKAFKDGQPHEQETEAIDKAGNAIYFYCTANVALRDKDGKPTAVMEIARDITEQKQAEEALRASEERYRSLVNNVKLGILRSTPGPPGRILAANPAFEEITGYSRDELLAMDIRKLYVDLEERTSFIEVLLSAEETISRELHWKKKDGTEIVVLDTVFTIRDSSGRVLHFDAIIEDITERKQMAEALKKSEENYRSLINNIPLGVFRATPGLEGRFLEVNPAMEKIFGYSKEELLKMKVCDLYPNPEDRAVLTREVQSRGQVWRELTQRKKDGSEAIVSATITGLRDETGEVRYFDGINEDITERRRAEEKYQTIIKTALDGSWIADSKGRFLETNDSYCKMTGYTREELLTMSIADIEAEENPGEISRRIKKIMEQGHARFESRHRCKDGRIIDVDVSVNRLDVGKELMSVFIRDITERKQLAEELRRQKEFSENVINSSIDGILAIDPDYKYTLWNPGMERISGVGKSQVLGKCAFDAFPHIKEIGEDKLFKDALKGKVSVAIEKPYFIAETGRAGFFEGYYGPLYREPGVIEGAFAIIRDITARREAEAKLIAQKELIDRILSTSPNSVVVLGRDQGIKLANRAFQEYFHQDESDCLGKQLNDIICERSLAQAVAKVISSKQPNRSFKFSYTINNSKRILVASITPMQEKETLIIFQDVTEESERQERLYLTDRLASIGEMASGVAHELNNPLTGIIGLSQVMLNGEMPDEIAEDIRDIYKEAKRAAAIVRNMLTFARKHTAVRKMTQVSNIIDDVMQLRAYEHRVNDITVKTSLDPELPEIMADYHQLQQVFLNIVLNAESVMVDANGKGTLTITAERAGSSIKISFRDDGPGIPRKNLAYIFDPFFTTKEVGKGTGLGLSICYGIVTEHGGKIYAQNNPDRGATFVVELPISSEESGETL